MIERSSASISSPFYLLDEISSACILTSSKQSPVINVVVVLSILCFLGLQHHVPVPNGNLHQVVRRNVLTNSKGSGSEFAAQSARKVAVPFGDVSYNTSSFLPKVPTADSDLIRRAKGTPSTLDVAVCKGKRLSGAIASASTTGSMTGQDARTWTVQEVEQNG